MNITMQAVKSSQIEAVGHNAATQTLAIRFKGGSTYRYDNVPAQLFADMLAAESVGSFFYKHIKPRADLFPFKKVNYDDSKA